MGGTLPLTHASYPMPRASSHLHSLDKVGGFLARLESHISLAPVSAFAFEFAHALHLSANVEEANLFDFHVEELLDGVLDLDLVGLRVDLERNDVRCVAEDGALLRHQRPADDLIRVHFSSASVSRCSADWLRTMKRLLPTS